MKLSYSSLFIAALVISMLADVALARAQTYDLYLNGELKELEVGKEVEHTVNGTPIKLRLERKEVSTYSDDFVTFKYPGSLEVAKKALSAKATQLFLASATGTLVIVQEHTSQDPAGLTELMIKSITKSDLSQGFKIERGPTTITLKNGKSAKGVSVTTMKAGTKHTLVFLPYGDDAKGLFIVTRIAEDDKEGDGKILSDFWDSVEPKF